jgi:hypothetical protein
MQGANLPAATRDPHPTPQVRKNGVCPWLRPDGKTQVTVEYKKEGGAVEPVRVHTILISTQHSPGEGWGGFWFVCSGEPARAWGLRAWGLRVGC